VHGFSGPHRLKWRFVGQNRGRGGAILISQGISSYYCRFSRMCQFWWKSIKNATARVHADGQIHWHTDWQTDRRNKITVCTVDNCDVNPCAPLQGVSHWKWAKHSTLHCIYGIPITIIISVITLLFMHWETTISEGNRFGSHMYLGTAIWIHNIMLETKEKLGSGAFGEMCV